MKTFKHSEKLSEFNNFFKTNKSTHAIITETANKE